MDDILAQMNAVARTVATKRIPAGDGRTVGLTRTYDAEIEDVWGAVTTADRIGRWFAPIEGDLRPGGTYQLKDNARGEILACEPPHRLRITWVYGDDVAEKDVSEVEVRLDDVGGRTTLVLEHTGVVDDEMWAQYGPGAGGVGWDLGLLALDRHLRGTQFEVDTWEGTEEGEQAARRSAQAWGDASLRAGEAADLVTKQVTATTEFYTSG